MVVSFVFCNVIFGTFCEKMNYKTRFLTRIYFSLLVSKEDCKTEGDIVPVVGSQKSSELVVGDCQNVPKSDDYQNVPSSDDYQNVSNSDFCRTFRLRSPPTDEDDDWNWRSEQSEMIAYSNAKNSHLVRLPYIY